MEELVGEDFWRKKILTDSDAINTYDKLKIYEKLFKDKFLLSKEVNSKYREFIDKRTIEEIYELIINHDEEDRNFYEVIVGCFPQKVYFDIDIHKEKAEEDGITKEKLLSDFLTCLRKLFMDNNISSDPENNFLIYSSHGETKSSYHIVIRNVYHTDYNYAKKFYNILLNKLDEKYRSYIDNIYKSSQQLRTLYSQKKNSNRIKKRDEYFMINNIIYKSNISKDKLQEFKKSYVTFLEPEIEMHKFPLREILTEPIKVIKYKDYSDELIYILKENKYDQFEIKSRADNLYVLDNQTGYYCKICERDHEHENPFVIKSGDGFYFYCRRTDKNFFLGKIEKDD